MFVFSLAQHSDAVIQDYWSLCIVFLLFLILSSPHKSIYCLENKHIIYKVNLQIDIIEENISLLLRDYISPPGSSGGGKLFTMFDIRPIMSATLRGNADMVKRETKWESRDPNPYASFFFYMPTIFFRFVKIKNWYVPIKVISVLKDIAISLSGCYWNSYLLRVFNICVNNWSSYTSTSK